METALWELLLAGLVTADGFDNLRAFLDQSTANAKGTAIKNPVDIVDGEPVAYPIQVAGSATPILLGDVARQIRMLACLF